MTKRTKVIGQNGPDGYIYKVEAVARILSGDDPDEIVNDNKRKWEFHINKAMEIVNKLEEM